MKCLQKQEAAENTYPMQDIQWGLRSKPFGGVGVFQPCANVHLC